MKKIFLLFSFLVTANVLAQNLKCGVPDEPVQTEMERRQLLSKIKSSSNYTKKSDSITYIPIKMHLFGMDDNTGYVDSNTVNDALAELNKQFKPIKIEFYFSGTSFNHYPNSIFYNAEQTGIEENDFHLTNAANNAMNVYLSNVVKLGGSIVGGWSYISPMDQSVNMLWVNNNQFNDNKTTPHEFGHYFGLLHTFNGSTTPYIPDRELVTRNFNEIAPRLSANCQDRGDYLCDTPSDPRDNGDAIVSGCIYSGTVTDANGDLFNPSISNYMDYNFCSPYNFSLGQYNRMNDGLLIVRNPTNNFTLGAPETIQETPTDLKATAGFYSENVSLSWKDNSNVETGYIIERSTNPEDGFIAVAGVGPDIVEINNLPTVPNVSNYFRIKASNTKSNYSNISNPIVDSVLCGNNLGQTCDLSASSDLAAWRIENFTLSRNNQTLIDNSNSGCSVNGIGNYFDSYAATVLPGQTLSFTVTSKEGNNGGYDVFVNIYADWNVDNDFDDVNELVYETTSQFFNGVSNSFIVPDNISMGNIRLRVILSANFTPISGPCGAYFGEIEDYKLVYNSLNVNDLSFSEEFKFFPNPTKSILNIKTKQNLTIDKIIITDLAGKIIKTQFEDTTQVNVQNLAEGMYIIQAFSGEKMFRAKFVKK